MNQEFSATGKPEETATVREVLALFDGFSARGVPPAEAARAAAEILSHRPAQKLLTPGELAAIVNRSRRTVMAWCQNESIPVVKTGEDTVGIHFPTFLACCTRFTQPRGGRQPIKAGEIAARLVGGATP